MSKSYWSDMDKRSRAGKPKFKFWLIPLIIILTLGICFGVYMLSENKDVLFPAAQTIGTAPVVQTEVVTETTAMTTAATPETTETLPVAKNPVPEGEPKDMSYFDNCVFIGDSLTAGFSSYGVIPEKNVYASIGMNIDKINTEPISVMLPSVDDPSVYSIQEMTVLEALKISKPKTVYIMLGSNGIAWLSNEYMIEKYSILVNDIKEELPGVEIYIFSIPPVTAGREAPDSPNGQILNESIDAYNSELLRFANENELNFVDINTMLKGNDGKLPDDYASRDGMHFNKSTYQLVVEYILKHTV